MFAPLVGWLGEHLYAVVFLGAIVDAVGLPFPGRLMLITAGSFSRPGSEGASTSAVIVLATIGTVAGDHVWYLVGQLKGRRLFDVYCRFFGLSEPSVGAADRFLRRFGGLALMFARLAATLRLVVMPLAVSRGMSYGRFVAFDAVGAALWVTGCVWLGRAVGVLAAGSSLRTVAIIGTLVTAGAAVGMLARRRVAARCVGL